MTDRLLNVFPTTILQRHLDGMEEVNRQISALVSRIAATLECAAQASSAARTMFSIGSRVTARRRSRSASEVSIGRMVPMSM